MAGAGAASAATVTGAAALTRHTLLPTSSATSSAPLLSSASPTARPLAWPPLRKPVTTSIGFPAGLPFSVMLLLDPTPMYSLLPSGLASRHRMPRSGRHLW